MKEVKLLKKVQSIDINEIDLLALLNEIKDFKQVLNILKVCKEFITNEYELEEVFEEIGLEIRYCSMCGNYMIDGYLIEDCLTYYCSDECANKDISEDLYWTEWTELNENNNIIGWDIHKYIDKLDISIENLKNNNKVIDLYKKVKKYEVEKWR